MLDAARGLDSCHPTEPSVLYTGKKHFGALRAPLINTPSATLIAYGPP